jgi:ABC-type branched-subunit amino acid transport system substrate-binding protein
MKKSLIALAILVVLAGVIFYVSDSKQKVSEAELIKIGVITDLTGPAAYWGESAKIGVKLAVQDLADEGIVVQPVIEDYQLDAAKAASAAQKLSNIDKVSAVYVGFDSGAIAASSVFKGKNILYLYESAIESPLKDSPSNFKTYLDYRAGCQAVAQKFKEEGIKTVGMLKINREFGELCVQGVQNVYGVDMVVDSYNIGDADLRTQIAKFKSEKVGAIVSVGFPGDTSNTLKAIRQINLRVPYGTNEDGLVGDTKNIFAQELKGAWSFGLKDINEAIVSKFVVANDGEQLGNNYAAVFTYLHIKQLARALAYCNNDEKCAVQKMAESPADDSIGFTGFVNRVAQLQMSIKQY